jgi:hypothetical protein
VVRARIAVCSQWYGLVLQPVHSFVQDMLWTQIKLHSYIQTYFIKFTCTCLQPTFSLLIFGSPLYTLDCIKTQYTDPIPIHNPPSCKNT